MTTLRRSLVVPAFLLFSFGAFQLTPKIGSFKVMSASVQDGQMLSNDQLYNGLGCNGKNLSPDLTWNAAPKGTESYAITAYDPDAPTGSGWWHWVAFNIPVNVNHIAEGASVTGNDDMPDGTVESNTDYGKPGYGGACPPEGKAHKYVFTVHALKVRSLPLDKNATAAMVGYQINENTIAKASIKAKYVR